MKKIIAIAVTALCILGSTKTWADGRVQLDGKMAGANGSYVYLSIAGVKDSALVKNGTFRFQPSFQHPDFYTIGVKGGSGFRFFVASAGKLNFSGNEASMDASTVTGECVKEWNTYNNMVKANNASIDQLEKQRRDASLSDDERKAIGSKVQLLTEERRTQTKTFIDTHPNSALSPYLIINMFMYTANASVSTELPAFYNALGAKAKQSYYGQKLKDEVDASQRMAIGAKAPAFTQRDKDGKEISLADFKGKYVILDFWGSWCSPCRKSHPHLVELYKKYKGDKFEILGLAGNDKLDAWTKAVADDGMVWPQVNVKENDPKQALLNLYNIRAFPTKILLSPEGTILAYCIGDSEAIDAKLQDVFGK